MPNTSLSTCLVDEDKRPEPPSFRDWSPALTAIIHRCWARSPSSRPDFATLDGEIARLRKQYGWKGVEAVLEGEAELEQQWEQWIDGLDERVISPSLTVVPLPSLPRKSSQFFPNLGDALTDGRRTISCTADVSSIELPSFDTYVTARASTPRPATADTSHTGSTYGNLYTHETVSEPSFTHIPELDATSQPPPEVVHPHTTAMSSSRASSMGFGTSSEHSEDYTNRHRPMSPTVAAERRDERRYRMSLQHEYHASRKFYSYTH